MDTYKYTTTTQEDIENILSTSIKTGLLTDRIPELLKKYGKNEIKQQPESAWMILFRQFKSPFTHLLVGAALLSGVVGDWLNSLIIILIVLINGLLSFFQEYHAHAVLQTLKKHLIMQAKVIRDGQEMRVPNTQLVPGDIIRVQPGDYVPADVRFIEGTFTLDESVLTGESLATQKISDSLATNAHDVYSATNLGFFGTTVTHGSGKAVVIGTGSNTLFGAISHLSLQTTTSSSFQQTLTTLSRFILTTICITVVCLFVFQLLIKGTHTNIIQLLLFCIAIALGITPEALPTVTTFALSRGALLLAHKNVIVKRLSAIEDLGAVTILCTDKTGTLTENKMAVIDTLELDPLLIPYALLASKRTAPQDPFDKALLGYAPEKSGYTLLKELPFDPNKRSNAVVIQGPEGMKYIIRGAYESLGPLCARHDQKAAQDWISQQASKGNRVLAVAYKSVTSPEDIAEHDLILAGLIAFQDPIKKTVAGAVLRARQLGITVKMITGDSKEVACAVAHTVGLVTEKNCGITGAEFAVLSFHEKQEAVQKHTVFSRILPEQKYEIVNLLKEESGTDNKQVVAYLGEGINDAPALKAAHVGLAVQGASDIAQDAADIILLKKSLTVIIDGIAQGRSIFLNITKYLVAVLSSTFGNFYSLAIASLILDFLPMLPLQVLLVNLLSDLPMVAIATDTSDIQDIKKPLHFNLKAIAFFSLILGLICPFFDFMFFALFYHTGPESVQTNWFIQSILMELALIYSVRTHRIFYKAPRPSPILLILSVSVALLTVALPFLPFGQKLFLFQATTGSKLFLVGTLVVAYFIATEAVKLFYFSFASNNTQGKNPIVPSS